MASGRITKVKGKVLDIPNPPTIGTATAGAESASVAFTASSKGGPTRSYIAKSNPSNITATGSTSPINVTGLTAGTSYTISVAGVNETGTGEYSSASNSVTPTLPTSYQSISTVTVGAGGSSLITFSSIPATFKHLQIRFMARSDRASTTDAMLLRIGTDATSANYTMHALYGDGAAVIVFSETSAAPNSFTGWRTTTIPAASNTTTQMQGVGVIDILDYTNTNKKKTFRALGGLDTNNTFSGQAELYSGVYLANSNAITTLTLKPYAGGNFTQYSSFALYGIKG